MISVFTPVHAASAPFLREAYDSLLAQTVDWEWVILPNNGGYIPPEIRGDYRVRVISAPLLKGIGALKHHACMNCQGDQLLEFDADDLLAPTALEECAKAFENPAVQMVYSNCVEFDDKTWVPSLGYSPVYGWQYRVTTFRGHKLLEAVAWPATYQSMRRVLWSPNHLRAFRSSAYKEVGGHDPKLALGDDFDLLCRFYVKYGQAGFRHIDRPLYFYRVHEANTVKTQNQALQVQMNKLYLDYIESMAFRWTKDNGLLAVELGAGINPSRNHPYLTVDLHGAELDADLREEWPFLDGGVGIIVARHVIEHLPDTIHFFNEAYRVLAPGGLLMLEVPSVVDAEGKVGLGSFRDPTHKSFFCPDTIRYFTQKRFAQFIPAYKGRFQESRIELWNMEPNCPVISAELIRLGEPYESRHAGEILI